jgi:hypothetical protein
MEHDSQPKVYCVHVWIREIHPMLWRRFLVRSESTLADLHVVLQTYDTKPKRRLFELMKSQGLQANQQVTFLSDGADDVRELPLYLSPESEHWLDWFHVAMRLRSWGKWPKGW